MIKKLLNNFILVITAALGMFSLLLFWLFLVGNSFTVVKLNYNNIGILAWNSLLCIIFFVQHSGMIRKSFRSKLSTRVTKRFQGALYSVASGISLLILVLFWQNSNYTLLNINGVLRWILHGVFMSSMVGMMWSFKALGTTDMLGIRSIINNIDEVDEQIGQLSIKGPYKLVRHPLYFFILLQIWLRPNITIERLLFNVFFTIWIVIGTYLEERDLITTFGETYQNYQLKVPKLIPWKLSLKQE